MINIYEKILNILKTGESLVTATILDRAGSAPRDAGAKMIIKKDASIIGTIGGGMFEATAIQLAESVFKDQKQVIKRFVLTDKDASGLGMTCGGELEMFLEHIDGSKKEIINKYERIVQLAKNESKFVVMTELSDKIDYDKCVCTKEDIYETKKIYSIFKENQIDFNNLEFQIVEFEQKKYLIEPVSIFEYVYIFGAGHISQKLATVTKLVNFKIVVLDDRKEFASRERFPDADEIRVIDSFDKVSGDVSIDNQSYVVIVTRGHAKDKEVLAQMLKTDAKYIGMIGSKKKIKGIYDQLLEEGFTEKDLERVYSPIGIDIQAETPEEIAISIVAELIQIRREEKDEK